MLIKVVIFSAMVVLSMFVSAQSVSLVHAPFSRLQSFLIRNQPLTANSYAMMSSPSFKNTLQTVNITRVGNKTITRYQQMLKGVPIVGSQVMIIKSQTVFINGQLTDGVQQLNTKPAISAERASTIAKNWYFNSHSLAPIRDEGQELQLRALKGKELRLVYAVFFKYLNNENKPKWPYIIIDAESGEVLKQWDNMKTYADSGPGGNDKVQAYWYGRDGLPPLNVSKKESLCIMDTNKVRVVNLQQAWDWFDTLVTAHQYPCGETSDDGINGAYSPINDAYYFGHTIVDMYQQWYGLNALQSPDGQAQQLIMRVHFGQGFDNAFWDGQTLSFGDGENFYPLVSLDITGHEITHGFTEQHAGLEYYDESGALNEAFSDMAGVTSRAYLLETIPLLFNKLSLEPDHLTWGIGETIVRDSFAKALRFMDEPSQDGYSADCLDKNMALAAGASCFISYDELKQLADAQITDPDERQSFIVHAGSGVFNKAFYLMSGQIGIKKAFQVMLLANTNYWVPSTDFHGAACGVLNAANELKLSVEMVKSVFYQVGVDTANCVVG